MRRRDNITHELINSPVKNVEKKVFNIMPLTLDLSWIESNFNIGNATIYSRGSDEIRL